MKIMKKFKNEIKNFWNSISKKDKTYFSITTILTIIVIIIFNYLSIIKNNNLFSVTLFILYFPIQNIFLYIGKYINNRDELKLIHFYSKNIIDIYEHCIKPIIDKNPNLIKYETIIINSIDAMNLKEYLLVIKKDLNQINNSDLFSFEEKRCMYILNARIDEFLEKSNIPDMKEGEVYIGEPFEINWRSIQWFISIPDLLYKKTIINNVCFFDTYKKYNFEDLK
jgi:hypothetical protein